MRREVNCKMSFIFTLVEESISQNEMMVGCYISWRMISAIGSRRVVQ